MNGDRPLGVLRGVRRGPAGRGRTPHPVLPFRPLGETPLDLTCTWLHASHSLIFSPRIRTNKEETQGSLFKGDI